MIGAQLRLSVVIINLADEVIPTLDKSDFGYQTQLREVESMKQGTAMIVSGCVQTLKESHLLRDSEVKRLARYMEQTFPTLFAAMPDGERMDELAVLRTLLGNPRMKHMHSEVKKLVAIGDKAAE